ncbi:hypothetical protein I312_105551 [Cryptococcus bacillisporus CA1280]|uniref:uncharacterized protein n=1 Tax=Cryptococcus bacillisporus CA1280 TaxID=1296109 RepID=UPI00336896BC
MKPMSPLFAKPLSRELQTVYRCLLVGRLLLETRETSEDDQAREGTYSRETLIRCDRATLSKSGNILGKLTREKVVKGSAVTEDAEDAPDVRELIRISFHHSLFVLSFEKKEKDVQTSHLPKRR